MMALNGLTMMPIILVVMLLITGYEAPKSKPNIDATRLVNSIGPDHLDRVFIMMEAYGLEEKRKSNLERNVNQYMVAAMMSREEIESDSAIWGNEFPRNSNLVKKRMRFYLNREGHNEQDWNVDRALHGEIQLILNDLESQQGLIHEFHEFFKDKKSTTQVPILMLFSYYIPCANVPNLGYSCAEQLAKYMKNQRKRVGMAVAFNEIWRGTDPDASLAHMQAAKIAAYERRMEEEGIRVLKRRKCHNTLKRSIFARHSSLCRPVFVDV